jgi:hypothetical protein
MTKWTFKTKTVRQAEEDQYIKIKGSIHKEHMMSVSLHAPNFIKQILLHLKRKIGSNTLIVGDFNTPLSPDTKPTKKHQSWTIL